MTRHIRFFALSFLLCVVPAYVAKINPTIGVDTTSIRGSGFTPGHDVVIFGAANVAQPYCARLMDYLQIVTVDASGAFRWTPSEAISPRSVWFAVDLASTEYATAYPGSTDLPLSRMASPAMRAGNDTQSDALSIDEYAVKVLLVRANDAVWMGSPIRHGSSDLNRGKAGALDIDISQLRSVRGSKHLPGHLVPSDFIIVIEPVSLRFYAGPAPVH